MLDRTHNPVSPWTVVRANDKRAARLNLIRDLLNRLHYGGKDAAALVVDPTIVFQYDRTCVDSGAIAR
jgi:hypothetical protein